MYYQAILTVSFVGFGIVSSLAFPTKQLRNRETGEATYWDHEWHSGSWKHEPGHGWQKQPAQGSHKQHHHDGHHKHPSKHDDKQHIHHHPHPHPPAQTDRPAPYSPAPTHTPDGKTAPTDYASIVVKQHNIHRANHSAPDLTWNQDLADIATKIAHDCTFAHNTQEGGGGYGQNIAAGTAPTDVAQVITNEFYDGEVCEFEGLYGAANPSMKHFENWGHFSQVVWKATSEVGCATVHCASGLGGVGKDVEPYFTVCNYKGPGNVAGEYAKNVGKPLGHPSVVIH